MDFVKIKKFFELSPGINGLNLGDILDAKFEKLSECSFDGVFEQETEMKEQIKLLEQFTENVYKNAEETQTNPLPENDDKVIIENGTPYHKKGSIDLDTLRKISVGGLLASEWFGQLESEAEGRFCAFINSSIDETSNVPSFRKQNIGKRFALGPKQCVIYFDKTNPIMQMLMKFDFFEYRHLKSTSPEKIEQLYPKEIIDIYENLIAPMSPAGKKFHDNPALPFYDWLAIPGGIPPELINGICINSKDEELMSKIDEISKMFPYATIFNESQKVLASAKIKSTGEPVSD